MVTRRTTEDTEHTTASAQPGGEERAHEASSAEQPDTTMAQAFREATHGEEAEEATKARPYAHAAKRRGNGEMHAGAGREISDELVEDVSAVTTAAAVGVAAALIEAELLPGILIGAGALIVGKMFPRVARGMRPVAKMMIRGGIAITDKARETVAETGEQFQDMVAEVRAERDHSAEVKARRSARRAPEAEAAA